MSRSSRRPGYGPQRGAKNPIITISGTKPVQPKYDDIWIDDTRPWALSVGCMYTSYAEAAVGTTTQTTLFGTGDGTRTIPANWLQQGTAIWARIYGYHTANTETLTLAVKLGDTTVCTVAAAEVAGTQKYFEIDTIVTCYSAGTAGTVRAHGRMLHGEGTATQIFSMVSTASTVIDTSTTLTFDVLAAWSSAAANPSIVSAHANMNICNGGFLYGVNWWYCAPIYYSDDVIGGENSTPVGGAISGGTDSSSSSSSSSNTDGYLTGGITDGGYTRACDNYTPDTWTSKTDMPTPKRQSLSSSTINNKVYIYCGYDTTYLKDCDEYSPDTWSSKTDAPTPARQSAGASTINSKGYIYCGFNGSPLLDCDEYNPDTWSNKTDAPSPSRYFSGASTINSKGYIYGGTSGSNLQDCDEYDASGNSWANKTDAPTPSRHGIGASTINSKGYIYGGLGAATYQDCDEYDASGNSWANKTDMPAPSRRYLAASTISNKGYSYCGGISSGSRIKDCDEYDASGNSWANKTDYTLVKNACAATTI